ncbi:hypothetical protein C1752_00901 [Acaryochloris thomasi RCC1774]|uniref:DUF928 domain-containing protein n=1 Tax=Acaryochloris thomasi RCC1774 TaxID=1764569 RepID=A0A2W1JMZ8_9CYAN|nr:DUF928 domain-containing protein [Acaryochloris thomasi]PZD74703.1 hypothetical protein C1752_00901 [Acaryochloris thomasi RCC1774]
MHSNIKTQARRVTDITALVITVAVLLQGMPSWAGFNPRGKRLRRPGNRQAAATRPICRTNDNPPGTTRAPEGPPLKALVPENEHHLSREFTTAAYPTFHWYMPNNNPHPAAQFVLYKVSNIEPVVEEIEVFSTRFQIRNEEGIASLKIPAGTMATALEVDTDYRWQVKLLCLDEDDEYVTNQYVEGWITRIKPSPELTKKIAKAKPIAQIDIFAEAGLWYDALTQLTTLHRSHPKKQRLEQEWQSLSNSEFVQLADIPLQLASPSQ